jgi:hypothetical protein
MSAYRLVEFEKTLVLQILRESTGLWRTIPTVKFNELDAGERKEIIKEMKPLEKYVHPSKA